MAKTFGVSTINGKNVHTPLYANIKMDDCEVSNHSEGSQMKVVR